jgi:hypothetical protein
MYKTESQIHTVFIGWNVDMDESNSSSSEEYEEDDNNKFDEGQNLQQDDERAHCNKYNLTYILNDMRMDDGSEAEEEEANRGNVRQDDEGGGEEENKDEDEDEDMIYANYGISRAGETGKQILITFPRRIN